MVSETDKKERYNSYAQFLKKKFNTRIYKVSVDAGFTCPNIDGKVAYGGCTFCNNESFTPPLADRRTSLVEQINRGKEFLRKRYNAKKFVVYFQSYTNTYASAAELEQLWELALENEDVIGLTIGTRPDCVDQEKISQLEKLARNYFMTIEYGVQSIHDGTLEKINRGHNYQCFVDAIELTRDRGIYICGHIILGFPYETRDEILAMANELSKLDLDFLKIHHLQVIRGTQLAKAYYTAPFHTFRFGEYTDLIIEFLERLSPDIVVQRLFSEAPDNLLIAPHWGMTKDEIYRGILSKLEERDSFQGKSYCPRT